jgi:aminopeptidase N
MRATAPATLVALAVLLLAGCGKGDEDGAAPAGAEALDARLAEAFRIDVSEVDVTFDLSPSAARIEGSAVLRFRMRPGQSRPLFHFQPLGAREPAQAMLRSVELDGERLDPQSPDDLRRIRPAPSAQPAFEIQRDVPADQAHTLEVSWWLPNRYRKYEGWFYTAVNDTARVNGKLAGRGNEALWPTVNSPDELARHRIELRVHARRPYTTIGSGVVRRREAPDVQIWDLDTERPVSSYTVMLATAPADEVRRVRFEVRGVPVTIVSDRPPAVNRRARATTRRTLGGLIDDLGPFPMPALRILLIRWGSGMEYYGATKTGIGSLEHELAHMYFGASAVNRTWRDTWIDEAITVWLTEGGHAQLPSEYSSAIARGRTAVHPSFDGAAYGAGARIMDEIAEALGGDRAMLEFLADLHDRRAFEPFTTDELIGDIVAAQDEIGRAELERWLFSR